MYQSVRVSKGCRIRGMDGWVGLEIYPEWMCFLAFGPRRGCQKGAVEFDAMYVRCMFVT